MLYDLILANKDEADLPSGHKRKKKGDVISIQPHGHVWGTVERKTHIIITMDISDSLGNLEEKLKCKSAGGDKRAYSIPLAKLQSLKADVDNSKIENDNLDYQPYLDAEITSARDQDDIMWSKDGNQYISPKDAIVKVT